ncbi:hypothetical protein IU500_01565 [Nocardia terpenica]|uniref:hypothetical protein n=1 Tax=Nocardia terpenica TaxID=455432 RepID=UPI001895977A|nr:hypothetical protein [Nocardia terpenica]MBF6059738.1 hypothetical protein [Nocardia terpenica]MBF6102721.1 hypothetical protein [Nocardia terpenica]MBF6111088.1 hypothetical protein [Nocardia terpenica]MBF6117219.1 hypothetical protein [Nocardia terpenica]MBF6150940.1 hypothetical protein [Nocardia terpenica]
MLKSYKDLARWYPAVEPEGLAPPPAPAVAVPAFDDAGAARFPHYIRDTEPEPFDIPFTDEPAASRAEFVGGWSDWVADHAPGPDDDYPVPDAESVRFPWDDEDGEPHLGLPRLGRDGPGAAASFGTLRERAHPNRWRVAVVLAVAVLLLVAAACFALYLLYARGGARHAVGPPAPPVRLTAATGEAAPGSCPTERSDRVLRGAEPGGTDSGPDAIMWFQHSYYVERSAERAREVVAPDAAVSPAPLIQRGIDSIPPGTGYCVRVITLEDGKYAVEVTERRPNRAPTTYDRQTVTTAVIGGRTLITGITAG